MHIKKTTQQRYTNNNNANNSKIFAQCYGSRSFCLSVSLFAEIAEARISVYPEFCIETFFYHMRLQYIQPSFGFFFLSRHRLPLSPLCPSISASTSPLSLSLSNLPSLYLCRFSLSFSPGPPLPRVSFHSVAFIFAIFFSVLFIYSVLDIFFLLPIKLFCSLTFHMHFFLLNRIFNQSQFGRLNRMILHFNFFLHISLECIASANGEKRLEKNSSGKMYGFFSLLLQNFNSDNQSNAIINI